MKFLKVLITIILATAFIFSIGCSASDKAGTGGAPMDGGAYSDGAMGVVPPEYGEEPDVGEDNTTDDKAPQIQAGQITAGAQDDNKYYDMWKALFERGQTTAEDGKMVKYIDGFKMNSLNRVKVTVTAQNQPAVNADVALYDEQNNLVFKGVTNANGVAYVFGKGQAGKIVASSGESQVEAQVVEGQEELALELTSAKEKQALIEIMIMLDVTGSMGDEISYLKAELADVINRIATANQDARISLAMLFYRDNGDDVKFSYADFLDVTDASNLAIQQSKLNAQYAEGGGDYPEAVDEAFELAMEKQWSKNSTKILFHVADAPPHSGDSYQTRYSQAIKKASELGIRVCPIIASGADGLTEYLARQTAVLTGGTFVFITNHSGIGGDHYDPNIPNVVIEYLNDLMVRLVTGYYTGTFPAPVSWAGHTYYGITYDYSGLPGNNFLVSGHNHTYVAGQTVTIVTNVLTDVGAKLYVNGEFVCSEVGIYDEETQQYYWTFTFVMPEHGADISFETYDGYVEIE